MSPSDYYDSRSPSELYRAYYDNWYGEGAYDKDFPLDEEEEVDDDDDDDDASARAEPEREPEQTARFPPSSRVRIVSP